MYCSRQSKLVRTFVYRRQHWQVTFPDYMPNLAARLQEFGKNDGPRNIFMLITREKGRPRSMDNLDDVLKMLKSSIRDDLELVVKVALFAFALSVRSQRSLYEHFIRSPHTIEQS